MKEIAVLLKNTRFRRCIFGGIDTDDVWKKLERLQKEYVELVEAERQRAQGVINEWRQYAAELEAQLRQKDGQIRQQAAEHQYRMRTSV